MFLFYLYIYLFSRMHQMGKLTKNVVVLDSCNDNKRLSILFYTSGRKGWTLAVSIPYYEGVLGELIHVPLYHHDFLRGQYKRRLLSYLNGSESSVWCTCVFICTHVCSYEKWSAIDNMPAANQGLLAFLRCCVSPTRALNELGTFQRKGVEVQTTQESWGVTFLSPFYSLYRQGMPHLCPEQSG